MNPTQRFTKKKAARGSFTCSGKQNRTADLRVMNTQIISTLQYFQGFSCPKMNLKEHKCTQMHQKCDSRCDSNFSLNLDLNYEFLRWFLLENTYQNNLFPIFKINQFSLSINKLPFNSILGSITGIITPFRIVPTVLCKIIPLAVE